MLKFLCKKALILFLSLLGVITATFILMKLIPGDPFLDEKISLEVLQSLRAYYGLDQPVWIQYIKYLKGFFTFDFGRSLVYSGRPVTELIARGWPVSAQLGLQALLVSLPCGILLGTWAALKRSKWQDSVAMVISTLGSSIPNFVLASLLQYFIALKLHLFPVALWGSFQHTILPTLALSALPTAFIARLTRSNMVEVLGQEFVRTAIAKGLPLFRIALVHGLRNALLPVLSYLGPISANILTGSFVVERIFALPGLGDRLIMSIHTRDYPSIMGMTVFYTAFLMISVFLSDIAYSFLDPRVRTVYRRTE